MSEVLWFLLFLLIFWLLIYIIGKRLPLDKYGLNIQPLFIKWESRRFRNLLYECSSKWRRSWKIFSQMSIFIGIGLMVITLVFLSWNLIKIAFIPEQASSITIIIPGITLRLYWLPYFLIAVVVTIFLHEAAHGIVALSEGINIRSAGALLLAVFFGGFVEPDERELSVAPLKARMKVFSAGSASNILVGIIIFLIISGLFIQSPGGLIVLETLEGGPLSRAGIGPWDMIYALDSWEIRTSQDLREFMSNIKPGDRIVVRTVRGDFIVTAAPSPEGEHRAIIGLVSSIPYYASRLSLGYQLDTQLYLILNWLFIVLVSVAAFNMLPIPQLDGDKLLQCLLEKFPRGRDALKRFFNMLSIFLLLANIVMPSI